MILFLIIEIGTKEDVSGSKRVILQREIGSHHISWSTGAHDKDVFLVLCCVVATCGGDEKRWKIEP